MKMGKKFGFKALVVASSLFFVMGFTSISAAQNSSVKGFSIQNGKLIDANGNAFIMKGINHAHNWYKGQDETAIRAIAKTGANVVRIVLSNGQQWSYDDEQTVKDLINLCKENKLIAIVEVHDATGSDSEEALQKATDYWIGIKNALIGNEDTVIVNIANEWYGTWGSDAWASGYIKMIPQLRNAGIKNTLMVDCAGWGQYPKAIKDKGKAVFASDPDANTMFSMHLYEYAGGNASTIKNNIDGAVSQGLAVCVGEFGYKHIDGDVDEEYILNYTEEKGIGWLGWSWYGNGDSCNYLDMATDMGGSRYTEWGEILMEHQYGLPTAQRCSVFEGSYIPETPKPSESPEPTQTPEPTETPLPSGNKNLAFRYTTQDYGTSYRMDLYVVNNSDTEVDGWKLKLKKSGFALKECWSASVKEEGEYYIFEPEDWNKKISAHSEAAFGVIFEGQSGNPAQVVVE